MDKETLEKRVKDLGVLGGLGCCHLVWHTIVVPAKGEQKELANQLHSTVGSLQDIYRHPKLRKKLEALVREALKELHDAE